MSTKRSIPLVAGAAIAGLALLAACGTPDGAGAPAAPGASAPAASGTITAWARAGDQAFITKIVDAYNGSQTKVTVKLTIVPDDQFVQKFGSAAASGSAPDVAAIDTARVQYFASVGALQDVTGRLGSLDYAKSLAPAQLSLAKYKGADYAVPFSAEASVLFYNKTLFKQAKLDPEAPPKNFAELQADAEAIRAIGQDTYGFAFAGAGGGPNNFQLTPMIWASGGALLSDDGSKAMYNSAEVTSLLQLLRNLNKAGAVPASAASDTGPNVGPSFVSGKVGMISNGAFFVQQLITKDPGFKWGIAPLPGKDGGTSSFTGGDELAVPSGSKNPEAAWSFIQWATGKDAQKILAGLGIVPVRTDLLAEIYTPLDPRYAVLAEAVKTGRAPQTTLSAALFGDPAGPLATMIHEAAYTDRDIAGIQKNAQDTAQNIIDKG